MGHKLQASDRHCEHPSPTATLAALPLGGALCPEEGSNNGEKRTNYSVEETDTVVRFNLWEAKDKGIMSDCVCQKLD